MIQGIREFMFWTRNTWSRPREILPQNFGLLHAVMGLAGEAGEVLDLLKKKLFTPGRLEQKGIVFSDALGEELGDVLYYFVRICDIAGYDPVAIMNATVAKLEDRYPEKAGS